MLDQPIDSTSESVQTDSSKPRQAGKPMDVPIALLLRPRVPARATFGQISMEELCESITKVGLIQPLAVMAEGDTFRICAGDRRFNACKALGWSEIPCMVYQPGEVPPEAIKSHENAFREDLNPAEEARYFEQLLREEHNGNIESLAAAVVQSVQFVDGRLALLSGDQNVFAALERGQIGVGVARELNRVVGDAYRKQYLDVAISSGSSERVVRAWRQSANEQPAIDPNLIIAIVAEARNQPVVLPSPPGCYLCGSNIDQHAMRYVAMHEYCQRLAEERAGIRQEVPTDGQ